MTHAKVRAIVISTIHIVVVIIEYLHVNANDIHKGAPSRDKGEYGKANKAGDKTTSLLPVIGMQFFMEIFEMCEF